MEENIVYDNSTLIETMVNYIGKTVTIFVTSGGKSGQGFTGILAAVTPTLVKLITDIGAAPACPLGSNCRTCKSNTNFSNNRTQFSSNWLGSVTDIPINSIVAFTHHAI
jgi:hypothetical protein